MPLQDITLKPSQNQIYIQLMKKIQPSKILVTLTRSLLFPNIQSFIVILIIHQFYCSKRTLTMMATADKIYTNVSKDDSNHNGETLTLKMDQTFHLHSNNSSWDSSNVMWNWDSTFTIEGVWSYNEETKTITLSASKFKANIFEKLQNQEFEIAKGFPNRVVSTPNFNLQSSNSINGFVIYWDYYKFVRVAQGALKRK